MEEPAQLQIPAVVLVGGLDGHVEKVLTALHSYHSWRALVMLLDYFVLCIVHVRMLGREGKSTGVTVHILPTCHYLRVKPNYIRRKHE